MAGCCSPPGRDAGAPGADALNVSAPPSGARATEAGAPGVRPTGADAPARPDHEDVPVPGGAFAMGDPFGEGYAADGETPVHPVTLAAFRIDAAAVSNAQFAAFVRATGYRTESEVYGTSAVFHLALQARPQDVLGSVANVPWWLNVRGADWAHPAGQESDWRDIPDHPVTQVSHNDALAYCSWAGRRLPTEAEWEFAARGGLAQARYPWGDELEPLNAQGIPEHRCNIWQGTFPTANTLDDGYLTTAPVRSFTPNGYGLYQTSGNVWEWCSDWFLPKYYRTCAAAGTAENPQGPSIGRGRVMRGGSYLCHQSYCNRYRLAARSSNSPDSAAGNCGFRTVAP